MESNRVVLCANLIKWLQTLNLTAKHGNPAGIEYYFMLSRSLHATVIIIAYFGSISPTYAVVESHYSKWRIPSLLLLSFD